MHDIKRFLVFVCFLFFLFIIFRTHVNAIRNTRNTFHQTIEKNDIVKSTVNDYNKYTSFDLCFLRMFFILFAKFSSEYFFFMYSKSIITSWYFQFLFIKKAIIDKYDWRFEADQQFNVKEILTKWDKCSNKNDSISLIFFMMWLLIVKKNESLPYEFKH
jgi:hypothetical protein